MYDSLLNFDKELQVVWRWKPTPLSALYIVTRYVEIISFLVVVFPVQNNQVCLGVDDYYALF